MSSSFDVKMQSTTANTIEHVGARRASSNGQRKTPSSSQRRWRRNLITLILFTAPAIIWYLFFMIGPFISMFYDSALQWDSLLETPVFQGLGNYNYMFSDPTFYVALRNTAIQVAITLPINLVLSFLLGYYLSLKRRGYQLLNIICFTPTMMSAVASAMLFVAIYAPNGIVNVFLNVVGLRNLTHFWYADTTTSLGAVIGVTLWGGIGFWAVVCSARISAISPELYEAADIDGATQWQKIRLIVYPMVREFFGTIAMLQFLGLLLGSASTVLVLTNGGPGTSSTTLAFMLYNEAFVASHMGYSQAIGVFLFVIGFLGMGLIRSLFRPTY